MKLPIETYIGSGWDQLLSLISTLCLLAAGVSFIVITWLRLRLRRYFITRPDHEAMVTKLAREHETTRDSLKHEHSQNIARLVTVEEQLKTLATRHSVAGIEQRQESLNHRVNDLSNQLSGLSGQVGGLVQGGARIEHMMGLVLQHLIEAGGAK